jgi:hypothetical protein
MLVGWSLLGLLFWYSAHEFSRKYVYLSRNLYGVQRMFTVGSVASPYYQLVLAHGDTTHGAQFQNPSLRREPTTYYSRNSGVGLLLGNLPLRKSPNPEERKLRLGAVGLGAGTVAAYALPGDYVRFYEINPEVIRLARGPGARFTFLNDSSAQIDVVPGDARISMERELAAGQPQKFDVLVLDAFNSDSIPVHLLTREAMGIYLRHLRGPGSVLAFHTSNYSLDLRQVLYGLAAEYRLHIVRVVLDDERVDMGYPSDWLLMCADEKPLVEGLPSAELTNHHVALMDGATLLSGSRTWVLLPLAGPPVLWTDDYSNPLQLLR